MALNQELPGSEHPNFLWDHARMVKAVRKFASVYNIEIQALALNSLGLMGLWSSNTEELDRPAWNSIASNTALTFQLRFRDQKTRDNDYQQFVIEAWKNMPLTSVATPVDVADLQLHIAARNLPSFCVSFMVIDAGTTENLSVGVHSLMVDAESLPVFKELAGSVEAAATLLDRSVRRGKGITIQLVQKEVTSGSEI
jgi:hypothetical protein